MPTDAHKDEAAMKLLEGYREIERLAEHMLVAARADLWGEVNRQEDAIRCVANRLTRTVGQPQLGPEVRRERLRVMKRLLNIDADVRRLAEPGAMRLEAMLRPVSCAPRFGAGMA